MGQQYVFNVGYRIEKEQYYVTPPMRKYIGRINDTVSYIKRTNTLVTSVIAENCLTAFYEGVKKLDERSPLVTYDGKRSIVVTQKK